MIRVHVVVAKNLRSVMAHSAQKTIFFIRHGETTGDVENRWGGAYDDHLTPRGAEEARVLAEKLKTEQVEAIVTSSLVRAQETGAIINLTHVPVIINEHFNERDGLMHLTGMRKEEAALRYPDLVVLLKDHLGVIPGGETYEAFSKRVQEGLVALATHTEYSRLAVVSHGGPLSVVFREILKAGEIAYTHCSFAEIFFDGTTFSLGRLEGITLRS